MLCLVIKGPTLEKIYNQLKEAKCYSNLVEWRLDCFQNLSMEALQKLKNAYDLHTIFTVRPPAQGGEYRGSEEQRLRFIQQLAFLQPDFVDLEYTIPLSFFEDFKCTFPRIKIIASYHNFKETPDALQAILERIQCLPADIYKIAVMAHTSLDTLKLLNFSKQAAANLIALSMGKTGYLSRILASILQQPFAYASLRSSLKTAPGQMSVKELMHVYQVDQLLPSTTIYGCIGSMRDCKKYAYVYNALFKIFNLKSVYVPIPLSSTELPEFFDLAHALDLKGLTVTGALRKNVIPYLNQYDRTVQERGSANTLVFKNGNIIGYNIEVQRTLNAKIDFSIHQAFARCALWFNKK